VAHFSVKPAAEVEHAIARAFEDTSKPESHTVLANPLRALAQRTDGDLIHACSRVRK